MAFDGGTPTAILFPGQGSVIDGMKDVVERLRPDLLDPVTEAVGEDPFERLGAGTRFDQPAIFCTALAGYEALGRPSPEFFAGHSLGEITALVAAGALTEDAGLALVAQRGRLMEEAAGPGGGMLAVRASRKGATELAERAGLAVANDNGPSQVVLSGPEPALDEGVRQARELQIKAKRLPVSGAFHSPAMEPAVKPFRAVLAEIDFREPRAPVLSCVTAEPFDDPRRRLADALVRPVRWLEVMQRLQSSGVSRFVETGPGRVLTGLVRRALDGVDAETAEIPEAARA